MYRRAALDAMPFPPGVGGGRGNGDANSQGFEVITADRAIDENNVGNRMLRSMGWQEGLVPFFSLTYMDIFDCFTMLLSSCLIYYFFMSFGIILSSFSCIGSSSAHNCRSAFSSVFRI